MENTSNTRVKRPKKRLNIQAPIFPSKRLTKELRKQVNSFTQILKKSHFHNNQFMNGEGTFKSNINDKYSYLELLRKFMNKKSSIELLPSYLLNSELFYSYENCQILVHEKGKTSIDNYYFSKDSAKKEANIDVTKYNSLYNLVKKSKRKLFSKEQISNIEINVLGTFLAKDFEFKNHSIILIISRNGFLPSTPREISYFESITQILKPTLGRLLIYKANFKSNKVYQDLFNNFPLPLQMDSPFNKSNNFNLYNVIEDHSLDNNGVMKLYINQESSSKYDIYHLHRINLLGELLNTLKHEISNPLFGIKLGSELLAYESLEKDSKETLADIEISCERCQEIMDSFSYLCKDMQKPIKVDFNKLLKETITLTKSETRQIEKIIVSKNKDIESLELYTNPTYLSQIIFNLIINASQSIKRLVKTNLVRKAQIIITLEVLEKNISINIMDSGEGLDPKIIDLVFEPFFTTKTSGTGLGLSICINLAKQIGAKISCYNNINSEGATFCLEIPFLMRSKKL